MLQSIPAVTLAGNLVPELSGLFSSRRRDDMVAKITAAIHDIAGTTDIPAAIRIIESDATRSTALKAKLGEIQERFASLASQDLEQERQTIVDRVSAQLADRQTLAGAFSAAKVKPTLVDQVHSLVTPIISISVLVGFFGFILWMAKNPLHPGDEITSTLLHVTSGALVAGFTAVVHYWTGFSHSMRNQDRTITALQEAHAQHTQDLVRILRPQPQAQSAAMPAAAPLVATSLVRASPPPALPRADAVAPGDAARFEACVTIVLREEGGFVDNPADPGRATNLGITIGTLAAWRHRPVTIEDVRHLSVQEAKDIYRANYWNVMQCGDLPAGVDLMVFDFGVNAGPDQSVKILQEAVGVTADGVIGPITLHAVGTENALRLVDTLAQARLAFYRQLPTYPQFGAGWTRRVTTVQMLARRMAA